jgi:hypothetical protein
MFIREKRIGRYTYVYLVETVREDGRIKRIRPPTTAAAAAQAARGSRAAFS